MPDLSQWKQAHGGEHRTAHHHQGMTSPVAQEDEEDEAGVRVVVVVPDTTRTEHQGRTRTDEFHLPLLGNPLLQPRLLLWRTMDGVPSPSQRRTTAAVTKDHARLHRDFCHDVLKSWQWLETGSTIYFMDRIRLIPHFRTSLNFLLCSSRNDFSFGVGSSQLSV